MPTEDEQRELKNSIFAAARAAAAAQGGPMAASQGQAPRDQMGIDLPVGDVPLPSKGKVYPAGHPLHDAETVAIKAMTSKEEDILMNRTFIRRGTVISELIKSSLLDKNVDVNDMISGDRNALMIAIRITGYGADYKPPVDCPKCEAKQELKVQLNDLPVKELDLSQLDQVEAGKNEFRFLLPMTKRTVTFKFLTGREEEKILQDMEATKKKGLQQSSSVTTRLINSILSIDGRTERDIIARFCQNMPAQDSHALRKHIDKNEPGVDMTCMFECEACGHTEKVAVPMGPSFFWPDA